MKPFNLNFYRRYKVGQFAYRSSHGVPRVGDKCVFDEVRYVVAIVEWCFEVDASTTGQQRINIELEKAK